MADYILEFVDCTSLSINYDVMGIATINFTIITNSPEIKYRTSILGFNGYVINVTNSPMLNTSGWYMNNVTLISTKGS